MRDVRDALGPRGKVNGKRPVKIERSCPNEVCVLGDW